MSRLTLVIVSSLVALAACAFAPQGKGRYLYEVTCAAELARFDTVEKKKTGAFNLATRPGAEGLIPISAGVLEVCLAKDTVFDPSASVFYTLAPTRLQQTAAGTLSYRLLSFSVPELRLVGQVPAGDELEYPPRLELSAGRVRVVPPGEQLVVGEDLSGFAPDRRPVPNEILEWSAARVLLRLNEKNASFGVADRASKMLIRLEHLANTAADGVHLSPGGSHVLVEELTGSGPRAPKTGRLIVHDAGTGRFVKALFEPRIVNLYYRGMAPNGVVLYQDLDRDELFDLGMTFPVEPVVKPTGDEFPAPTVFFADR